MKLREYLDDRNFTANDFGGIVGVSGHAVLKWMRGERVPRPDIMEKIVEATSGAVQPNDFYGGGVLAPPSKAA
jgi:transcriptional regulator with XRE-family HTH domain